MQRRVGGLETEYGLVCVDSTGARSLEPEQAARELFRPVVAMGRSSNVFLSNAARLYLDVGSHPEFATAECDDWWDLVAQDRAGERIFADLAARATAALADKGVDGRIHLFKNNEDSAGSSFGSHENYLVDRRGEFTRLPLHLVPFLVTRQIVTGAGGVVQDDDGPRFVFSRRSDHMWEAVSSATTRTRPIINTRDEPHGDSSKYRRLHVIVGDSTMSEVSSWLRFAMTDLVLRVIESGRALDSFALADPIASIRVAARDLSATEPLPLADGGALSALEIQRRWLELARSVATEADAEAIAAWERALDALASADPHSDDRAWARTHLDWAIKRELLEGAADRKGLALDSPGIQRLELAYHDIDPSRGLFFALQRRGLAPEVLDPERIDRARTVAPTTTRAHLRGRVVTEAQRHGVDHVVDWTTARLGRQGAMPVTLMDPFMTESAEIDRLVDEIRDADQTPLDGRTTHL